MGAPKWFHATMQARFRVGSEELHGDILLTRIKRKPPLWKVETYDSNGNKVECALSKAPKGIKGWEVILPKGEGARFRTKKQALAFITILEAAPIKGEGQVL